MDKRLALRARALAGFEAGIAAADPTLALSGAWEKSPPPNTSGRIFVISVGKAALRMAQSAQEQLGASTIAQTLVVTNPENAGPLSGARVMAAAHPVPDQGGLAAGEAVLECLNAARAGDLVIALISGGASALLPAPTSGLSLDDKMAVNKVLLSSGLDITQMNLIRQNLSELKGGGALRRAAPAQVVSYVLSDVLGDDLRVIGSGPTVGPIGTPAEARALAEASGVWRALPDAARAALSRPALPPPPGSQAHLIGSNSHSLHAMARSTEAAISQGDLVGDVQQAAERIWSETEEMAPGAALAFGGETTVNVTGSGRGGRNQELALRVALEAEVRGIKGPWVFLSGGTDGRDGPTDAAGGFVDDKTLFRLRDAGLDVSAVLAQNDAYPALKACGDLLMTGPTGTNVADLQIMLR